jgi:hypothetical protein
MFRECSASRHLMMYGSGQSRRDKVAAAQDLPPKVVVLIQAPLNVIEEGECRRQKSPWFWLGS